MQVFNNETVFNGSWCIKKMNISLSLAVAVDNQLDNDAKNYELSFTAYNNCDIKRWLTFEEALKHLKGTYSWLVYIRVLSDMNNFNGSNTFGTSKMCSRQG